MASTLIACQLKTKKDLLTGKWQLVKVLVADEITDKPDVINWLKEMNIKISRNLIVTEYTENNKLLCYLDNFLLNGLSNDKTENDNYRLVNDKGFIDEQGNFIMYYFNNNKSKIIKEEILSLTDDELMTRSYDPDFIKMAGNNHLIFIYKKSGI